MMVGSWHIWFHTYWTWSANGSPCGNVQKSVGSLWESLELETQIYYLRHDSKVVGVLEIGTGEWHRRMTKKEKKIMPEPWKNPNIYGIWKGKCPNEESGRGWEWHREHDLSWEGELLKHWSILWGATKRLCRLSMTFMRTTIVSLGLYIFIPSFFFFVF